MPSNHLHTDVLILGGGVSGLWTLARLRAVGCRVMLAESRALGSGQTIWSQGIIHGGVKYALTGEASSAARAIAAMPEIWRACLAGTPGGEALGVDLGRVRPLSPAQVLWTTPGLVSRFAALAASKAIRTPVESLDRAQWPEAFRPAPRGIDLYSVPEPVLPGRDVVVELARGHEEAMLAIERVESIERKAGGRVECVLRDRENRVITVDAGLVAGLAGAGNEELARLAGMGDLAKRTTGKAAEQSLERALITCNKNGVPFDTEKPMITSGVRLGSPACTTRGFGPAEFQQIADLICEVVDGLSKSNGDNTAIETAVAAKVEQLTARFPIY